MVLVLQLTVVLRIVLELVLQLIPRDPATDGRQRRRPNGSRRLGRHALQRRSIRFTIVLA